MFLIVSILVFSLCAVSADSCYRDCEKIGWETVSSPVGDKRYYLGMHIKVNYLEATEFCNYHGMRLATVNSKKENEKLLAYMELMGFGKERVWLSGSDLGHEGKFIWMSTGAPLTFTNFMNGQPDNYMKMEHCLEAQVGAWNDRPCDSKQYFVCEY